MNEIFTVWVVANCYIENGQTVAYHAEERSWIDSYWTDRNAAVAEAERLWNNDTEECYQKVMVFGRKLNISGDGVNLWNDARDRLIRDWQ